MLIQLIKNAQVYSQGAVVLKAFHGFMSSFKLRYYREGNTRIVQILLTHRFMDRLRNKLNLTIYRRNYFLPKHITTAINPEDKFVRTASLS